MALSTIEILTPGFALVGVVTVANLLGSLLREAAIHWGNPFTQIAREKRARDRRIQVRAAELIRRGMNPGRAAAVAEFEIASLADDLTREMKRAGVER